MTFLGLNFPSSNSNNNNNNNGAKGVTHTFSSSQSQYNDSNIDYAKTKHLRHTSMPNSPSSASSSSSSDFLNILFLFFLYFLQGIPLGLAASLPLILSSRNVSYSAQAWFSLTAWPFSLKLLWAPIVDSLYIKRIGRRKSWLVPIQYLIGIFMLLLSDYVHRMVELDDVKIGNEIYKLTAVFFMFTFLAATQDIAVDGWGLTILKKENIAWASICNNAGSTTGVLIGNSLFLVLESAEFSNMYIRPYLGLHLNEKYGVVTLKEFMEFFGIVFIISTSLILIFKKETNKYWESEEDNQKKLSINSTFQSLKKILELSSMRKLLFILFTCRIAFATTTIRSLKLIEAGVPKEKLGLINAPFQIVQILCPFVLSKLVDVNKPLDLFLRIYPIRLFVSILLAIWVFYTPLFKNDHGEYPFSYFMLYIILNGICSFVFSTMALAKTSFFTRISDKSIGGTYMTLCNTVANIGHNWPQTVALYLIDVFTLKHCIQNSSHLTMSKSNSVSLTNKKKFEEILKLIRDNTCSTNSELNQCAKYGGKCLTLMDAFYALTGVCTLIGFIWLYKFKKTCLNLQALPKESWKINTGRTSSSSSSLLLPAMQSLKKSSYNI